MPDNETQVLPFSVLPPQCAEYQLMDEGGRLHWIDRREDALAARAALLVQHPDAEVRIYEVPRGHFVADQWFRETPDADGIIRLAGRVFSDDEGSELLSVAPDGSIVAAPAGAAAPRQEA